jgi:hypothetical protein
VRGGCVANKVKLRVSKVVKYLSAVFHGG